MTFEEFARLNDFELMPWQKELVEAIDSGKQITVVRSRRSGAERLYALALAYLDRLEGAGTCPYRDCPVRDGTGELCDDDHCREV